MKHTFPNRVTFGPGGCSDSFHREGNRSTRQAPAWVRARGLDAFEYEGGNGISAGAEALRAVGEAAREQGILMSVHAPYFISLSGVEEEKRLKSISYVEKSLWAAELLGADTVVIHSGSAAKRDRKEAMALSLDTLERLAETVGPEPAARLGIETMGKCTQLGTLDEVIEQCLVSPIYPPVVDFGHLYARACGEDMRSVDDYRRVFDKIACRLGDPHARHLHCHFSHIEFTGAGEKKHLTFADPIYGPAFEPLAEAILLEGVFPRIICESNGTQAEDALEMKRILEATKQKRNGEL